MIPAAPSTLHLFVAFLANSVSHKTIRVYLAAVRHSHVVQGFPEPSHDPLLQYALRGIQRQQGNKVRQRYPITPVLLKHLKTQLHNHSALCLHDKRMLWAAFCTAFYGFMRSSEFTSPSIGSFDPDQSLLRRDVSQRNDCYLLNLKSSKTDPFRHGTTIVLPAIGTSTCPAQALAKYLAMARSITPDAPLFQFANGHYLTRIVFTHWVKVLLSPSGFSSHSFRIGAATTAAAAGIPEWLIQTLGRWTSQCYKTYIRTPRPTICAAMRKIASTQVLPNC